jgi:lipoprotein-releasing system ATP-binding protein
MFEVKNLSKKYEKGSKEMAVLSGLDFLCHKGDFVGIFGTSGSGKSTLLHILGGLDRPDSGTVRFDGIEIYNKSDSYLSDFRNKKIGFVFQFYHLLPEFTAIENVMMPGLISGMTKKEAKKRADEALAIMELNERGGHRPAELSGGEQQRIAIARAIINRPNFILADEPTGNLDESTGNKVFSYFERLNQEMETGIIMVTHNPELIKKMKKSYELKGGSLHAKNI